MDPQEEEARTKAIQEVWNTKPEKKGDRKSYGGKLPRSMTEDKGQDQKIWVETIDTMESCVKALKSLVDEAKS